MSQVRQIGITTGFVNLPSNLPCSQVSIKNNSATTLDIQNADETEAGQLISLLAGDSVVLKCVSKASEWKIKGPGAIAAGTTSAQVVID